jgi:hypothetical protein
VFEVFKGSSWQEFLNKRKLKAQIWWSYEVRLGGLKAQIEDATSAKVLGSPRAN